MKRFIQVFLFLLVFSFPCLDQATTVGINDISNSIVNKAMAGAGVAFPTDSLTAATNPAGIVYLNRMADFGVSIVHPIVGYTANDIAPLPLGVPPGTHKSTQTIIPIPNVGYVSPFNDQRMAWGVSIYPNAAVVTVYPAFAGGTIAGSGVFGGGQLVGDLKQIFLNLAFAVKCAPQFSVGASLLPVIQPLHARGLSAFSAFSVDPANLSNRGNDYSYGIGGRIGFLHKVNPFFAVGGAYQPQIHMMRYEKYQGLFSNKGRVDVPSNGTIGFSFTPVPSLGVNTDVQRIWYRPVGTFGHPNNCMLFGPPCLGSSNGAGFGWRNTTAYKLGLQWVANPVWTLRAGYAYSTLPVPSSEVLFNILSPILVQNHFTAGFTYHATQTLAVNTNFMYAPHVTLAGNNQFNPLQSIRLFVREYEAGASLTWTLK